MNELLLIMGMSLVTFSVRYPLLAIFGKYQPPDPILQALKYVPPAVLAAIIAPALVIPNGDQLHIRLDNTYLIAGLVSFGIAWRSRNLLLTIIIGIRTHFEDKMLHKELPGYRDYAKKTRYRILPGIW